MRVSNPWKLAFLAGLSLSAAAAFLYGSVELTSTPGFCASCHEMKAVRDGWARSEHAKGRGASCRDCHVPGWDHPVSVVWFKLRHGLKDGYRHLRPGQPLGTPDFYFTAKAEMLAQAEDGMCLRCHADVRGPEKDAFPTRLGTVRGLHSSPQARAVRCVTCHRNMGHGAYE